MNHPEKLSGLIREVLKTLASQEIHGRVVYAKNALANQCGCSYDSIKTCIRRLKEYGFIEQGDSPNGGPSTLCVIFIVQKWRRVIRELA